MNSFGVRNEILASAAKRRADKSKRASAIIAAVCIVGMVLIVAGLFVRQVAG